MFDDANNVEERLLTMRISDGNKMMKLYKWMMTPSKPSIYDTRLLHLLKHMAFCDRIPNNNQKAVALAVARLVAKRLP